MAVYSIWESYFPPEATGEGQEVTERIWEDMTGFEGYLGHELLQDLDDPGHLLVVSRWDSQRRPGARRIRRPSECGRGEPSGG